MSMEHNGVKKHDGPVEWGPTRTKGSQGPECDLNNIIKRFTKTGQLTHISAKLGEYRDVSGLPDLHEAMNIVADAQSSFNELPAEIRKLCDHDVGKFLPFIDDPANLEQCIEFGLLPETARPKEPKEEKKAEAKIVPKPEEKERAPEKESRVQGGE